MSSELDKLRKRADEAEKALAELEKLFKQSKLNKQNNEDNKDEDVKTDNSSNKSHELTTKAIINRLRNKDYKYNKIVNELLGKSDNNNKWECAECGDGNINYIFILNSEYAKKKSTSIVIKQAPPYIRLVGPVWPLKQTRCNYEVKYTQLLNEFGKDTNDSGSNEFKHLLNNNPAPIIHFYDNNNYLFCMENLNTCQIYREQFKAKNNDLLELPHLGEHIGYFLGNILFKTSDLYLLSNKKVELMNYFMKNTEMMDITELVIFEQPYIEAEQNRRKIGDISKNKDKLEGISKSIFNLRNDKRILNKIYKIRELFRNKHESLLHGDLHTGSLMVNNNRTVAIDAEFSFYGPMSYDIGQIIGNMSLGILSQPIYNKLYNENRSNFVNNISKHIINIWNIFKLKFIHLWNNNENGNLFPKSLRNKNDNFFKTYQENFMLNVYNETLDFAASVMIRRCIGIADAPEYRVKDEKMREICEDRAIRFAHLLFVRKEDNNKSFDTIEQFVKTLIEFK